MKNIHFGLPVLEAGKQIEEHVTSMQMISRGDLELPYMVQRAGGKQAHAKLGREKELNCLHRRALSVTDLLL